MSHSSISSTMPPARAVHGCIPILLRTGRSLLRTGNPKAGWLAVLFLLLAGMPGFANQSPSVTKRTPAADQVTVTEGATVTFSLTATDATDPEIGDRGMVSVTWSVNGVPKQETKAGATNTISSSFSFKTDSTTVKGYPSDYFDVMAVATNKFGTTATAYWTLRVNNLPTGQTITFKPLPTWSVSDANFAPGATSSSGLPVTYTSSNTTVAEIVNGAVHPVGMGSTVITASQPGNADVKPATAVKQTLVVKSRVVTLVPGGGGTVTGAGLYTPGTKAILTAKPLPNFTFLRWEDDSQSPTRTLAINDSYMPVTAVFKATADISQPVITNPGAQAGAAGVAFLLPLNISSESLPTVTISGLPPGLRYDPLTKTITGIPTSGVGKKTVTITVKNANKLASVISLEINIKPLPLWAQGNFAGRVDDGDTGVGTASMTVSSTGAASGKLTIGSKTYSFVTPAYSSFDQSLATLYLEAVAKSGTDSLPFSLVIEHLPGTPYSTGGFARASVFLPASPDIPIAWMYRNTWKDADTKGAAFDYADYYTAILSGDATCGTGYFTFTIDNSGRIQTAGKLADGTAVTSSQSLLMDESGRMIAVIHSAPTIYQGGYLSGAVEFIKSDDQITFAIRNSGFQFLWENRNPLATSDYLAGGFHRSMTLEGGRYDPAIDLRSAFPKGLLSETGSDTPQYVLVKVSDYDLRYPTDTPPIISWTEYQPVYPTGMFPDGRPITVTPATGTGTGLTALPVHTPVTIPNSIPVGWYYDYSGENSEGLTISVDRKTGKFRGTFNLYYDYISEDNRVTGQQTMTHLVKPIAFEGVLTPVRPSSADGIVGGGFYLLPDKSIYKNQAGKDILYSFTGSHDFRLRRP